MNAALYPNTSLCRLALTAAFLCLGISTALAEASKLYVFWDTVSPDGKYAMAWSTTGEATLDKLPSPDDNRNPVANYVIEIARRKILLQLPDSHYWQVDAGSHPNHYSLETVWSENSRSMLAIYNSRWSTNAVFLVNVSVPRAASLENRMQASFKQALKSQAGSEYPKFKDSLAITFGSPWFVAPDQFSVLANASIPKHENPDFNLRLYFHFTDDGMDATLVKFESSSGEESADLSLNRTYRKLHGLLSETDQKSLVEEQRAWLIRRDAIKTTQQKKAFIEARTQELLARFENVLAAREKQRPD